MDILPTLCCAVLCAHLLTFAVHQGDRQRQQRLVGQCRRGEIQVVQQEAELAARVQIGVAAAQLVEHLVSRVTLGRFKATRWWRHAAAGTPTTTGTPSPMLVACAAAGSASGHEPGDDVCPAEHIGAGGGAWVHRNLKGRLQLAQAPDLVEWSMFTCAL